MSIGKDPAVPRKPAMDGNPAGTDRYVARQREKERRLRPLRIDRRTVILVPPEKCTPEYAAEFLKTKMSV